MLTLKNNVQHYKAAKPAPTLRNEQPVVVEAKETKPKYICLILHFPAHAYPNLPTLTFLYTIIIFGLFLK